MSEEPAAEQRRDRDAGAARPLPGLGLVLRRSWWAVLSALVGLGVGVAVQAARPAPYATTALLSVTADETRPIEELTRTAQALARTATAPGVVGDALVAAGQQAAAARPQEFVAVQAAPDAPLVSVTGIAPEPGDAQAIARTVASALRSTDIAEGHRVRVVSPAALPTESTRPSWVVPAGGAALAGGVALVLAAVLPARDRRRGADDAGAGEDGPEGGRPAAPVAQEVSGPA